MASYIFPLVLLLAAFIYGQEQKLYSTFTLIHTGTVSPAIPLPSMDWEQWDEKATGELTAMGMREQYLLGREIRRRYDAANLLNSTLLIDQVFVRMIDHNSSIESGVAFLRGFLNDNKDQLTAAELSQAKPPVFVKEYFVRNIGDNVLPMGVGTLPYHTHYPHDEDIFAPRSCPKAQNLTIQAFLEDPAVKGAVEKYNQSFVNLVKKYYQKIDRKMLTFPRYVPLMESILTAVKLFKETRLSDEEVSLVKTYLDTIYFYSRAASKEGNSYRASPMLDFMTKFLQSTLQQALHYPTRLENQKAAFVFTEDRMIASLLARLGHNVTASIPSASIVTFEVYGPETSRDLREMSVKLKFNDKEIKIVDCELSKCSYETFQKVILGLLVKDVETLCK